MPESEETYEKPIPFGIYAETGQPLEEIDQDTLRSFADEELEGNPERAHLLAKEEATAPHFGITSELDANDLAEAGWSVMFSASADQRIREALQPLLDYRKKQAGEERLFKIFEGATGYEAGQNASNWLAKRHVGMNVVNPLQGVPFYILLVAPPDEIPFEFQYGLDIFWAVGRIWFSTAEEFRQYAESVIQYETKVRVTGTRQMAIFSPSNDFDQATQLFSKQVATPLVTGTDIAKPVGSKQKFAVQSYIGEPATKESLDIILRGKAANGLPSLLLTGSHGVAFELDDPRQAEKQGALLCQDWPGRGPAKPEHYYAASDLPADACLHGMIHVFFACYGGGCPKYDNFNRANGRPRQITAQAMLSRLPQAMLAHPNGGALAVFAHVERAWVYSFQTERRGAQIEGFRDVFARILRGDRLGQATDQFNGRWAALSTELSDTLDDVANGSNIAPEKLASMWVARDDARNYIVFGDPAVRLRVEDMPAMA